MHGDGVTTGNGDEGITTRVLLLAQRRRSISRGYVRGYLNGNNAGNGRTERESFMEGATFVEYSASATAAERCTACRGVGATHKKERFGHQKYAGNKEVLCESCDSIGFSGIDPNAPTTAMPGSFLKQAVLAARYRAIFGIWKSKHSMSEAGPPAEALAILPFHPGDAMDTESEYPGAA